jgi:hypothetical protein
MRRGAVDSEKLIAVRQRLLRECAPGVSLDLKAVYTDARATKAALELAVRMAPDLNARCSILAPIVVPRRMPIEQPPVSPDHVRQQIISALAGVAAENEIRVQLCVCRDGCECLRELLPPGSLVFVGGRSSWPGSRDRRLERSLRAMGHDVVFVKQTGRRDA